MKTIKYIAAFLPLASLLVSCNDDFLDRYPQDSVTNETYWKTEEQLRADCILVMKHLNMSC